MQIQECRINRPNVYQCRYRLQPLSATSFTVDSITESKKRDVALVTQMGETVAILRDVEVYANRKEEIVTRMFGAIDMDHAIRTFHTFTPVEIIY